MVRTRSNKVLNEIKVQKKKDKKKAAKLPSENKTEIKVVVIRLNRDPLMSSTSSNKSAGGITVRKLRSGVAPMKKKPSNVEQTIEKVKKSSTPTLQNIIDSTFGKAKKMFGETNKQFMVNDFVLARMRGYAPWPAKVVGFTKDQRRAICYFYGSHNSGTVDCNQMVPFLDASDVIRLINMRKPNGFAKGVREIEIEHGIPSNASSLNEIGIDRMICEPARE